MRLGSVFGAPDGMGLDLATSLPSPGGNQSFVSNGFAVTGTSWNRFRTGITRGDVVDAAQGRVEAAIRGR